MIRHSSREGAPLRSAFDPAPPSPVHPVPPHLTLPHHTPFRPSLCSPPAFFPNHTPFRSSPASPKLHPTSPSLTTPRSEPPCAVLPPSFLTIHRSNLVLPHPSFTLPHPASPLLVPFLPVQFFRLPPKLHIHWSFNRISVHIPFRPYLTQSPSSLTLPYPAPFYSSLYTVRNIN